MTRIRARFEAKMTTALLLGGLLFGLPQGAFAAAGAQVRVDYIDVSKTPQFSVYVDYLDAAGHPVTKLDAQDLTLLLDGEPFGDEIGIMPFKQSEEGVAFVLLINNCKLYGDVFEDQKKALVEFVNGMRAKDRATVLYYSDKVTPVGQFTSDKEELKQEINATPTPEAPKEEFMTAVATALQLFPENDPTFPRRRAMVLLSDALDQKLEDQAYLKNRIQKEIVPNARSLGVKFYALGYTVEDSQGFELMRVLAKALGGNFEPVQESERNRLPDKFTRILNTIYGQYIVNFTTKKLDAEVDHTLQVNINFKGQVTESLPETFRPRPVEGWHWWVFLLIGVGGLMGLGVLVLIIVLIVRRKPAQDEDEEEEAAERECPVCGEPLAPEERTCESCMKTPHKAELKRSGGEWDGFIYIIRQEATVFGSREGDVVIEDTTISGKHAGIKIDDMKFELVDFNSTNGTYVNGKRISKQFLKDGDAIKFGQVDLKFNLA